MTGSAYFGRSRAGPHFSQVVFLGNGVKEYKSYDEQVDLLVERGMDIGDRDTAVVTLQRVNYYRLSEYWYPFRKKSSMVDGHAGARSSIGVIALRSLASSAFEGRTCRENRLSDASSI